MNDVTPSTFHRGSGVLLSVGSAGFHCVFGNFSITLLWSSVSDSVLPVLSLGSHRLGPFTRTEPTGGVEAAWLFSTPKFRYSPTKASLA